MPSVSLLCRLVQHKRGADGVVVQPVHVQFLLGRGRLVLHAVLVWDDVASRLHVGGGVRLKRSVLLRVRLLQRQRGHVVLILHGMRERTREPSWLDERRCVCRR